MPKAAITNGILLHVYHLETRGWEQLVWGNPESDKFGTVIQFAYTLLKIPIDEDVRSVIYSGPSTRDSLTEGAYTKQFLLDRLENMSDFPSIRQRLDNMTSAAYELFENRVRSLEVGPVIENTLDEVNHAAAYLNQVKPVDRVYQIAAASHAPRCLKNQVMARQAGQIPSRQPWFIVASDTSFAGTDASDVVVLEPPHRGDDPMLGHEPSLPAVMKECLSLDADGKQRVIRAIQDSLADAK